MFYSQCNNCNERWELGTAITCTCVTNSSTTIPVDRFSHLGQRTWVGLTDEDFLEACQIAERGNYLVAFQRIQAKLRSKNESKN